MSKEEIVGLIRDVWDEFGEIKHPMLTSNELSEIDSFLIYLSNLLKD